MKLSKLLLRSPVTQWLLAILAYLYIRLVYLTQRWEITGREYITDFVKQKKPIIMVFWHGRLLMIPCFGHEARPNFAVISLHRDGAFIAKVCHMFSIGIISGSSRKGGFSALKLTTRLLRMGKNIVITPDGPRGPRMRLGGNVIAIAQATQVPIIPLTYSSSRCKIFRSWDRFMLPLPFGRSVVICGKPHYVGADLGKEGLKNAGRKLEDQLNSITREADLRVGITPVEPEEKGKGIRGRG